MATHWRGLTVILVFLTALTAQPSRAEDFCSAEGGGLLSQLSGQWGVSHGAGVFKAAGMVMPYKGGKDAVIKFEHMADSGVIFATGVDQVGEMLVVPAPADQKELANAAVGPNQAGGACNWSQLPVLVGTSNYPNWEQEDVDFGPTACQRLHNYAQKIDYLTGGSVTGLLGPYSEIPCPPPAGNTLRSAGMTMTMVARFSSASAGSGYLLFEGESDGHSFVAYTPITLSRK